MPTPVAPARRPIQGRLLLPVGGSPATGARDWPLARPFV